MVVPAILAITRSSLPAFNTQVFFHPSRILLDDVVILAQRITLPSLGQQNSSQIRVARENNSEHVKGFTLQPIGRRPDARDARHLFTVGRVRLYTESLIFREGIKVE